MMRKTIAVAISVLGVVLGGLGSVPVGATIVSTDTAFLQENPLEITGYMWGAEAVSGSAKTYRVLRYVQLYNDSSKPLNLNGWSLSVQIMDSSGSTVVGEYSVALTMPKREYIAPNHHVVIDDGATVEGALPLLSGVQADEFQKSKLAAQLTLKAPGYLDSTVQVKPDSTFVAHADKQYYWQRALGTTGSGYLSSFTFSEVAPAALFNDDFYPLPTEAPFSVAEVYAYNKNDCSPIDIAIECGDYIKIHVDENVDNLDFYVVRTDSNSSSRTTSNTFHLSNEMVHDGYITLTMDDAGKRISLTNSGGHIWIEDVYGLKLYEETMAEYPSFGSKQRGYAWVLAEDGTGQWSTQPTPWGPSVITAPVEEVTTCPEGKYLNPDTGRCRTLEEAVNALAACSEGQERNPATNRCRAKVTTASSTLTPCGEGQERNPATNRCRSIASAVAELIPCNEGYERNPATNRCRKVAGVSTAAASNPKQLVESAKNTPLANWTWALVAVAATGAIGYGVYEWRHELLGFGRSVAAKFGKK